MSELTSLKANLVSGYVAQVYVALAGIVMLPLYLRFMGAEAYGLVAVFIMLQGWLLLLDMGLSPTLGRQMAQLRAGAVAPRDARRLLHVLEAVFAIVAVLVTAAMAAGAPWLATHWLRPEHLPVVTVATCLTLMAVALALRLLSGLYRGAVGGLERIVWLSGFNAAIATSRYAMVIPWFLFFGASPTGFFAFQCVVSLVEVLTLRLKCHALLRGETGSSLVAPRRPLKTVLLFSISVGAATSLWSALSQVDKLILSKLLTLGDYGYFNLAVVVASGVGLAAGPITLALSPRLAHLHAAGRNIDMIALYRRSTQLMVIIAASTATMLICFADSVLWAWTGQADLAQRIGPTLALYAAGNAVSALSTMVFFLQFAIGDLRLHLRGLAVMLVMLLPTLIWATPRYGMAGAGGAWLCVNLFYILIWTARIHHRFAPGLHGKWLIEDVAQIAIPTLACGVAARLLSPMPQQRLALVAELGALGLSVLAVAVLSAPVARDRLLAQIGTSARRRSHAET